MKFTGNVYAMKEGEIAFPNEPIITVEAPLIQAQVLETPMLCIMNHQMAVATKASRVCRATSHPVSEFGSRRAHGPWAAVYGAKAAIIAGCASTSNILTGVMNGVPSTGTMAHSFVTSYGSTVEGEHKAFCDYINTHMGENLILLIDTYDTLRCGVLNAIRAFKETALTMTILTDMVSGSIPATSHTSPRRSGRFWTPMVLQDARYSPPIRWTSISLRPRETGSENRLLRSG